MSNARRTIGIGWGLVALGAVACSNDGGESPDVGSLRSPLGVSRIIAAVGSTTVAGTDTLVEVIVRVPAGPRGVAEAHRVLQDLGAKPVDSAASTEGEDYTFTGLAWDDSQLPVTQLHNDTNRPASVEASALPGGQTPWGDVSTSLAGLVVGGSTDACPSLVKECKGAQTYNGANEVTWMALRDRNTLGVTWSGTSSSTGPEADVAMNTNFDWTTDVDLATAEPSVIDAQTVFLHEFGHVLGLGHSNTTGAVMEPVYAGPRRALHPADIDGISALYPTPEPPCIEDAECDDANPCTDDACSAGSCDHGANTAACDDGDPCTGAGQCAGGTCTAGALLSCPAGEECVAGQCVTVDPCGDGSCDAAGGETCETCAEDCGACAGSAGQCEPCTSDADCVAGARCFQLSTESSAACHLSCKSDADCSGSYTCSRVTRGYGKRCLPCG